jgi:hypothetical protein
MKTSKHTPGPWRVNVAAIVAPNAPLGRRTIATSVHGANARLIAAAPELLEALRDLFRAVESWDDPEAFDAEEFRRARALLARLDEKETE